MILADIITARESCSKTALIYKNTNTSYQELCNRARKCADTIRMHKFLSTNIGIFLPNSDQYVISYFAIAITGRTIVPIHIQSKQAELVSTVKYCELNLIISNTYYISLLKDYLRDCDCGLSILNLDNLVFEKAGDSETLYISCCEEPDQDENATALLLHTSGTTSRPKRVMLSHKNLIENAKSIILSLGLNEKDKTLIALPLSLASANTSQMLTHLLLGASIVIMDGLFIPNIFFRLVHTERITNFTGVPFMMSVIMEFDKRQAYDIGSLRLVCFGGGSTPVPKIRRLLETFPALQFVHMYGQTEAGTRLTHLLPEDSLKKAGSVGKPIPGVEIRIVDKDDNDVVSGQTGELAARGSNVMKGYFNREAETNKVLKNGWLYTGDLAQKDEDGYIYIVGRKKNVIISGGLNIYPEEIEEILIEHPAVKEAKVAGEEDAILGEAAAAYIVKEEAFMDITEVDIFRYCLKNISKYKVPAKIIFVESIPKTITGKIIRYYEGEMNIG